MSDYTTLVPSFIIYLNGERLSIEMETLVKSVTVKQDLDVPSSFVITMGDPQGIIRSNTELVGSEIKILMGYKDAVEEMISGEITAINGHFTQNEGVYFDIKGFNYLHRLKGAIKTCSFTEMTYADIVNQIASVAGLSSDVENIGSEKTFTVQRDLTSLEYLQTIAKKYNCFIWEKDKQIFFKKIPTSGSESEILEWGKSLFEFVPNLNNQQLVTDVEVRGFNSQSEERVLVGTASVDNFNHKIGNRELGGRVVKEAFGQKKEIRVDFDVQDIQGAEALALDILGRNSLRYVTACGKCEGNTGIIAGDMIVIKGIAANFEGKYLITSAEHKLDDRGYFTLFYLVRNTGAELPESRQTSNDAAAVVEDKKEEGKCYPEFTNLQWKMSGSSVTKAKVGETVKLFANCMHMDGQTSVKLKIYEKDYGTPNDFIEEITAKVNKDVIEASWVFEYTEDNDDVNSEQEQQEKGYTKPEYIFVVETVDGKSKSGESAVCEMKAWIKQQLLDHETNEPLSGVDYVINLLDGSTVEGKTDENGFVKQEDLALGKYFLALK